MYRVLWVDDDEEVVQINGDNLKRKGFQVYTVSDPEDVLTAVEVFVPHCIVLDVMMPGIDGFALIQEIRRETDVPVLFLTGRGDENDRIRGLSLGADDYVVKPCGIEELSLRIMAHIRRQNMTDRRMGVMEFPPLRIDLIEHKAYYNAEEIPLTNREFDLLVCLAGHHGRTMEFEQIGRELSGSYIDADRKSIMMAASRLRKKLEGFIGLEDMIETAWGKGYCFKG